MALLIFLIPLVLLYFFLIRPQQRRARERQQMVAQLKAGDEVITVGGLIGVVSEVGVDGDDDVLLLEVAEGIELAVVRRGIAEIRFTSTEELDFTDEQEVLDEGDGLYGRDEPMALDSGPDELTATKEPEDTADAKDD